jgi:hypothetical protein
MQMTSPGYLLSYGRAGDFGPFEATAPLQCRRGDRVIIRSQRGQEIGVVMRPVAEGHLRLLGQSFTGQILRLATPGDEELAKRMQARSQRLFETGRHLATDFGLSMEIVDAEILLDGRQAVLHYVSWSDGDRRPLIDALSRQYRVLVTLHDLALPAAEPHAEDELGCGVEGCGAGGCGSSSGGCGSCAAGGCGTCGSRSKSSPVTSGTEARVSLI